MAGGRPAVDLEQLAKELVEWSYLPDSLNLIGFSSPRRMSVTKLPHYASEDDKFREAFVFAKENISQNRFKASCAGTMPQQYFTRCEGMYDPLYHKYDRGERQFDSDLKKQENKDNSLAPELIEKMDALMKINATQERKIDENKISDDKKS